MKLQQWALIAEVVSGTAVVITLVVLIMGINENTNITRASMYADAIESFNATERTIMADPDMVRVFGAFIREEAPDIDWQADDRTRLDLIVVSQAN